MATCPPQLVLSWAPGGVFRHPAYKMVAVPVQVLDGAHEVGLPTSGAASGARRAGIRNYKDPAGQDGVGHAEATVPGIWQIQPCLSACPGGLMHQNPEQFSWRAMFSHTRDGTHSAPSTFGFRVRVWGLGFGVWGLGFGGTPEPLTDLSLQPPKPTPHPNLPKPSALTLNPKPQTPNPKP